MESSFEMHCKYKIICLKEIEHNFNTFSISGRAGMGGGIIAGILNMTCTCVITKHQW